MAEKSPGQGTSHHGPAAVRVQELESIGFCWNPAEDEWNRLFATLMAFRNAHGHCQVPANDYENPRLRAWVARLRNQKKRGQLTLERIQKLDSLGFTWNAREAKWDTRIRELRAFIEEHGHADIPETHPSNQALAT